MLFDKDTPHGAAASASIVMVPVWTLKTRLAPHLLPSRPIVVDYYLNTTNTAESFAAR